MEKEKLLFKRLGILKYVLGGLLILVGIMGGLEALLEIWGFRGDSSIHFFRVLWQSLWVIGNVAILMAGILYLQQGKILVDPIQTTSDSSRFNKTKRRVNTLIAVVLCIALAIILMKYLSSREEVEFLNSYR